MGKLSGEVFTACFELILLGCIMGVRSGGGEGFMQVWMDMKSKHLKTKASGLKWKSVQKSRVQGGKQVHSPSLLMLW